MLLHMLPKVDDKNTELKRYLDSVKASEATKIPQNDKQEKPQVKKETPKNDDYNEYDYSDDKDNDGKDW